MIVDTSLFIDWQDHTAETAISYLDSGCFEGHRGSECSQLILIPRKPTYRLSDSIGFSRHPLVVIANLIQLDCNER